MSTDPPDEYMEFARAAFEHRECRGKAEEELGGEVTAVHQLGADWACPHGVGYWLVPTAELRARVENGAET